MIRSFVIWLAFAVAAFAGVTLVGTLVMTFVSPLGGYVVYVALGPYALWEVFLRAVAIARREGVADARRERAS